MARISSGAGSKQNYGTPWEFLRPHVKRFGKIVFDLAAEERNKKHDRYFAKPLTRKCGSKICTAVAHDALKQDWAALTAKYGGILWLNPPFKRILPWVIKCVTEAGRGAHITMLSSAAVGSDWYLKHVFGVADVYILNGRLTFDSEPFMRDLMITHWWPAMSGKIAVWDWRKDIMHMLPYSRDVLVVSSTTYRIVVQKTFNNGFVQTVNEDGFKTLEGAHAYIGDVNRGRDTKSFKSQIIRQDIFEDVVAEAS
jgi:DNA N-6-adenine-methyltransferase (Dam)